CGRDVWGTGLDYW
nr:immunoglobulin heavy chain junction region [Macaca mulatta]